MYKEDFRKKNQGVWGKKADWLNLTMYENEPTIFFNQIF